MSEQIERARKLDAEGCTLPDSITGREPRYCCPHCMGGDEYTRKDHQFDSVWCLNCGRHFKTADAGYNPKYPTAHLGVQP